MQLDSVLNKFMRDTVDLILGTPNYTIRAMQSNAPRPTGAYGDAFLLNSYQDSFEQNEYANQPEGELLNYTSKVLVNYTYSVNFYRAGALDNAHKVKQGLARESIRELFKVAGLGLGERSQVRDLSLSLDGIWEQRATLDITFSAVGVDSDIINSIVSVDIAGEYQARGLIYNFNVEV